jgi:hypothetical protein
MGTRIWLIAFTAMLLVVVLTRVAFVSSDLDRIQAYSAVDWEVFSAPVPNISGGGLPLMKQRMSQPACDRCNHSSSMCSDLRAERTSLAFECLLNPSLSQCDYQCTDIPSSSDIVLPEELADSNMMWPSMNNGQWTTDPEYCRKYQNTSQTCLFDKYRWADGGDFSSFSPQGACHILHEHNISDLVIVGDSLGRHMWQGMMMVLSGDFNYIFVSSPVCQGETAFLSHKCRGNGKEHDFMCPHPQTNQTVSVSFTASNPRRRGESFPEERHWGHTLTIYNVGNHPPTGKHDPVSRLGIYNVSQYRQYKWYAMKKSYGRDVFLWVPPHFRISVGRHDESNERGLQFLLESHAFFAYLHTPTINLYRFTREAVKFFCRSPVSSFRHQDQFFERENCRGTLETWDGFHFGRVINIWKAHMVLHGFRMQRKGLLDASK